MAIDAAGLEARQTQAVHAQMRASQELVVRQALLALDPTTRIDTLDYAEVLRRLQGECQVVLDRLQALNSPSTGA